MFVQYKHITNIGKSGLVGHHASKTGKFFLLEDDKAQRIFHGSFEAIDCYTFGPI